MDRKLEFDLEMSDTKEVLKGILEKAGYCHKETISYPNNTKYWVLSTQVPRSINDGYKFLDSLRKVIGGYMIMTMSPDGSVITFRTSNNKIFGTINCKDTSKYLSFMYSKDGKMF